jgi:hypothetical protein
MIFRFFFEGKKDLRVTFRKSLNILDLGLGYFCEKLDFWVHCGSKSVGVYHY